MSKTFKKTKQNLELYKSIPTRSSFPAKMDIQRKRKVYHILRKTVSKNTLQTYSDFGFSRQKFVSSY